MNYFKNKYEAYQASQQEKAEQERVQRNARHPHKPDCKQSKNIELFDKEYTAYFTEGPLVLTDYKTRCQECGKCSNSDNESRRYKKERVREKYSIKRLADIGDENVLEDELTNDLVEVVASAFGSAPDDTADHLRGDLMLIARNEKGEVSGFASLDYVAPADLFVQTRDLEKVGGYFAAAAVSEKHKQHGIYHVFTEDRLNASFERKLPYIFTRTQNPAVEQGIINELRLAIEEEKIADFTLERRFVPECYGQQLAKKQPQVNDPEVLNAYSRLDTKAGDAYILLFRLMYQKKETR